MPVAPLPPPRDLTLPEPGSTTARTILSRAVGRVMSELRPLLRAHASHAPEDVATVDAALTSSPPGALAAILRRPHAAALVRTLRVTAPAASAALLTELLATLAHDLLHLGVLPAPLALRATPPRVVSLLSRTVTTYPARTVTRPFHALYEDDERALDETVLALADNNPLSMFEAHPDKQGNAIDLGGRPVPEWTVALRSAFDLVAQHLPELREEMRLFVQAIVPVGYDAEQHLSASYREALGTVYMTLHPSPMTMVEALVHEFSHHKLNALFEVDDVLENAFSPLYPSPVRPDPRPLHGVLLAVHAFVPVARLYEKMQAGGDRRAGATRYAEIVRGNREGTEVLRAHARPTAVGRGLIDELSRWDEHFAHVA